jgi:hypothetical protein
VTQPVGPGWLILMVRAATAPMLFGVPIAVMHWPTFSADGFAATVFRYLVVAEVVTVTLVVVLAARFLPCTTKPLADTEVTLPLAPPKAPLPKAPLLPLGRGRGLKLGRGEEPPGPPPPNPPNPPPNPPNPPAPVQLPLTGALIVTLVAVTGLAAAPALADPVPEGVPTTVTQLPTVTSFDVTVTVSVMGVVAVKVTVTCPEVGFWTSMLDPDTAAAVPTTPGKAARAPVGAGLLLGAAGEPTVAAGVAMAAVVPLLPQAVTARATIPSPARAGTQRRLAAEAGFVAAPIMVHSHPCRCSFAA